MAEPLIFVSAVGRDFEEVNRLAVALAKEIGAGRGSGGRAAGAGWGSGRPGGCPSAGNRVASDKKISFFRVKCPCCFDPVQPAFSLWVFQVQREERICGQPTAGGTMN